MSGRPLAVHFGAGAIGRGFLGQLYWESGFETLFVDVAEETIGLLNQRGGYPIRIVEPVQTLQVECVRAVHASETEAIAEALAHAEIAATSVGVGALRHVAPNLAAGIARRPAERPLNVLLCENLLHAGAQMRDWVAPHLSPSLAAALGKRVGFVETSIGRMVPVQTEAQRHEDPLLVSVEAYCELPVDAEAFLGPIPPIAHLAPKANFGAYVERKLFLHNTGHAAAAYLGWPRGHEFIWQAMRDSEVEREVIAAMDETSLALHRRHGLDLGDLRDHAADLRRRFGSVALADQTTRVAADPIRKLGPEDRLIGALRACLSAGIEPLHVGKACSAALRYSAPGDPSAQRLQALIADKGAVGALREVAQVEDAELRWIIP